MKNHPLGNIVFGIPPRKAFQNLPPGKVRIKLRNDDFATAFVRHEGTTRRFCIVDTGTFWELDLDFELGQNATVQ